MPTDTSEVVEQHDETVDTIAEMTEEFFGDDVDPDDLADDAFMRFIQEANETCGLAGIQRDDRAEVIIAGIRRQLIHNVEQTIQDIGWQVKMMFAL